MKQIIVASLLVIAVVAITSCGSSKKLGCPAVAKNASQTSVKV
jgi:predicted small lipoprotein YifL